MERFDVDVIGVNADLGFQPPVPSLIEVVRATRRVRLGPACLNPLTQHPHEIAGMIASLDAISVRRAYLGLARGARLAVRRLR